jgi:hypothetical protein
LVIQGEPHLFVSLPVVAVVNCYPSQVIKYLGRAYKNWDRGGKYQNLYPVTKLVKARIPFRSKFEWERYRNP